MQKSPILVTVAITAIIAMFVIGFTPPTDFAKASTCSAIVGVHGTGGCCNGTSSAGCSVSAAINQKSSTGVGPSGGQSSCSSSSASQSSTSSSSGGTSCSSHSP